MTGQYTLSSTPLPSQEVIAHQKIEHDESTFGESSFEIQEVESVYYQFGEATLCSNLHLSYDKLNSTLPDAKRESIQLQVAILKSLQCTDKQHIPDNLQFRDMGYMYFTDSCCIPFLKEVDC